MQPTGIAREEFAQRRQRLLDHAGTMVVLFDQAYIQYFTGFSFLSNERPIAFAQTAGGDMAVFVPEFEVERTRAETALSGSSPTPNIPVSNTR